MIRMSLARACGLGMARLRSGWMDRIGRRIDRSVRRIVNVRIGIAVLTIGTVRRMIVLVTSIVFGFT